MYVMISRTLGVTLLYILVQLKHFSSVSPADSMRLLDKRPGMSASVPNSTLVTCLHVSTTYY